MAQISRSSLYGKLNSALYKSMEAATIFCKQRHNPYVRFEHLLTQILSTSDSDIHHILAYFDVPVAQLTSDITAALDRLPIGSDSIKDIDQSVDTAIEKAWLYATLMFRENAIRSGHLLVAILKTGSLRDELKPISSQLADIEADKLIESFAQILATSSEVGQSAHDGSSIVASQPSRIRELFISYRRTESKHLTGRVFDHLEQAFGGHRVFKDVDAIPIGARDFAEEIRSQLRTSRVVVAVIGPGWLTVRDNTGRRRLDSKDDFVRIEIKWALEQSLPIVPILFDEAVMPSASELPTALRAFARCQAMRVREDPDFRSDMKKLVDVCRGHLEGDTPPFPR